MRSQPGRSRKRSDWAAVRAVLVLAIVALVHSAFRQDLSGQEPEPRNGPGPKVPTGRFVVVSSPVDRTTYDNVTAAVRDVQATAQREGRPGIVVLEINPGRSSLYHEVQGLAQFLRDVRDVKTVAWVPRTVQGNHALLALACEEIVLREGAGIGEIGIEPQDKTAYTFALTLAERHNRKVSQALLVGMLDPEQRIRWAKTDNGPAVLTDADFDRLEKEGKAILQPVTLKEQGAPGLFTSDQARAYQILAEHVLPPEAEWLDVARTYNLPREAMRQKPLAGEKRKATLLRIDEVISPMTEQFIKHQIESAVGSGSELLIFDIEAPAGGLFESMSLADVIIGLADRNVHTVAFVPRQARGGSAILALACDEIYVTPRAELGEIRQDPRAREPRGRWNVDAGKLKGALQQKLIDMAQRKRRPAALILAMADEKVVAWHAVHNETGEAKLLTDEELAANPETWTRGQALPETDGRHLLKLDGRTAHLLGLAEAPVEDLAELKGRLGLSGDHVPVAQRTWVDGLVFHLNSPGMTIMLWVLGLLFAWMEMHFGVGLFGISSVVCFTLFFWSRFLGGTADWLEVSLFVVGMGCLALEFLVLPGFGVFGVSGIILVLFSLVLASQTFIIPASEGELVSLTKNLGTVAGALAGVVILGAIFSRFLPNMPFFEGMVLTPPGTEAGPRLNPAWVDGGSAANSLLTRDSSLVGRRGTSTTPLRPAGKAQIDDELFDVVSEGVYIPPGKPVEIVSVEGTVIVVRPMDA